MKRIKGTILSLAAAAALLGAAPATAQDEAFPSRIIKIVVANPPGGVGDVITRVLGDRMRADLGQPVVIENRPGASTMIGTQAVARARPDGYTLLNLTASGVVQTAIRKSLPYSLERDLVPVIGIGSFPMVLSVPATSDLKSFADLTTAIRSKDGVTYASGGLGTLAHLTAAQLIHELKGTGTHVPFQGNSFAIQALMSGQVQMFFPTTLETQAPVSGGTIRPLAVTSGQRYAGLPDVPTLNELGFAGFNPRVWFAFMAPAGTPEPIVRRLHDAFAKACEDPAVKERLAALGFTMELRTPDMLSRLIAEETARWGNVVKENNIEIND